MKQITQATWAIETCKSNGQRERVETFVSRAAAAKALPTGKVLRIERLPKINLYRVYLPETAR